MNRVFRPASLIGVFMLATVMGASAQSNPQYRAEIPFGFEAAGKHYDAGKYEVGPLERVSSPSAIVIRNLQTGNARLLGANARHGNNDSDKDGKLTFVRTDGGYVLSQISTATFEMKMKAKKSASDQLAKGSSDPAIVAIDLKR
jgi:hypothetical protein